MNTMRNMQDSTSVARVAAEALVEAYAIPTYECGASIAAKRCAVCGQWKPATPLHYYAHQHSHDGMQSMCIECCKAYRRDRWKRAMQRRVMRARKAK